MLYCHMELPHGGSVTLIRRVMHMVTYEALFAFCILLVAVIALCHDLFSDKNGK